MKRNLLWKPLSRLVPQRLSFVKNIYRDYKLLKKRPRMGDEVSRRARLLGFARATRDNYIPKLAGLVQLLVSADYAADNAARLERQALVVPEDASILLYPAYTKLTRRDGQQVYHVDVKGWLLCPGLMTRKNRLIILLARQLTRGSVDQEVAINELETQRQDIYSESDDESVISSGSSSASTAAPAAAAVALDVLKERLSGFIARSVPNKDLVITVGSVSPSGPELVVHRTTTDVYGTFDVCIECTYKPSTVKVEARGNESIFSFQDVMLIEDHGIGIISDIDDTVKLTGVIGDKRELMRLLLLKDVWQWNIQTVVSWYTSLYNNPQWRNRLSFHYISNSPWQLFPTIRKYFQRVSLPPGSIHLKQYTGNIIALLMEPASSKKKTALYKVIGDFPHKKFICVGDSGEYDLEAYVDARERFPDNILAIYIRVVKGSLSDVDDSKVLAQMQAYTLRCYEAALAAPGAPPAATLVPTPRAPHVPNLIDLDSKPPPMVPKKPANLKGHQIRKPPLPERNYARSPTPPPPPPPPRRATTVSLASSYRSGLPDPHHSALILSLLQEIYPHAETLEEIEGFDRRGASWLARVVDAQESLKGSRTEIRFFTDHDDDLVEHTTALIRRELPEAFSVRDER